MIHLRNLQFYGFQDYGLRVARVPMEIFEGDDSGKEDNCFLCAGEFVLDFGVVSDKEICTPWVCVCVDSRGVVGDVPGRESVRKEMIYLYLYR